MNIPTKAKMRGMPFGSQRRGGGTVSLSRSNGEERMNEGSRKIRQEKKERERDDGV